MITTRDRRGVERLRVKVGLELTERENLLSMPVGCEKY